MPVAPIIFMNNKHVLSELDIEKISCMRGFSMLTIVFGHVGGYWFMEPYSSYLHFWGSGFLFFLSGVIVYNNYIKINNIKLFYIKRITSLLVPYYIICAISLLVFFIENKHLPEVNFLNTYLWLTIQPKNDIMPFPLGQVWFLKTYFLIFLMSPVLFFFARNIKILIFYFIFVMLIVYSGYYVDINDRMIFVNVNIYRIIFFSTIFMFGVAFYKYHYFKNNAFILFLIFFVLFGTFRMIYNGFDLNIKSSFLNHDLSYFYGTLFFSFITIKTSKIFLIEKLVFIKLKNILVFINNNIFSIFLIHSFVIYLLEKIPYFVSPESKDIYYGACKFLIVITSSLILSKHYTYISKKIVYFISKSFLIKKVSIFKI